MAYKKYIRRNGKLYGPYLYESKRVDGKVVSEYHGSEESVGHSKIKFNKPSYNKIFFFILALFFVAVLIYFIFVFTNSNKISGKAIFEVESSYKSGEPIDGVIKLSLAEGEFLPASSKIVFENSGKLYEFPVSEIIEDSSSEGNYYIKEKDIQGFGEGYGIEGEQVVYPELDFILQIYQEAIEEELNVEENLTEEVVEEFVENEPILDEDLQEIVGEVSPITGNSIKESRGFLGSLFSVTGMVSLEFQDEINGKVSKDKPFTYELQEGEKAELKHGSVYFEQKELDDQAVSLEIKDNVLSVVTDYSLTEKGYGENYLGDKKKTFSFDLSELNLVLEEGELVIKIIYDDQEIVAINTLIEEDEEISEEVVENPDQEIEEVINEESEVLEQDNLQEIDFENETVEEVIESSIWDISDFLTDQEKEILLNEFKEIQLKNIKSELFKGRIIRVYEIGEYSVEYSYDSSLNNDILEVQMERDRIKFLKDIAASISNQDSSSEILNEFQNNYTF